MIPKTRKKEIKFYDLLVKCHCLLGEADRNHKKSGCSYWIFFNVIIITKPTQNSFAWSK